MIHAALVVFSFLAPQAALAATYECSSEFGETVPLRQTTLKKGSACNECAQPNLEIPSHLIDSDQSKNWNHGTAADKHLSSQVKRKVFQENKRTILLDTRYATRKGPSFKLEVSCAKKVQPPNCRGQLHSGQGSKLAPHSPLILKTELFDRRITPNHGYAEIRMGSREHLGWIVRVFKDAVPGRDGKPIPVSASGEIKFLREDDAFIHDVGADEQLYLSSQLHTRIAALEIKFRCSKISEANTKSAPNTPN